MDTKLIKKDFPIFEHQPELVYLDSTATSLKPRVVVDKLREYYEEYSANIYRGVYEISEKATAEYEETRQVVAEFINAPYVEEVIFTKGTTESMNLLSYSLGRQILNEKDEIVTTVMEHHSNFVPWQQLAFETGADFKVIESRSDGYIGFMNNGEVDYEALSQIVTQKTKIFTLTYVSNVLGTINPIKEISHAVKKINPRVIIIVDAAQAAPHHRLDVQDLGVDFVAFSSHKMLGPTGVGVLWGKSELLEQMYPFQYGGEMINEVTIERSSFKSIPHKFEAGTPHIAGVIAFKEAIKYLENIGVDRVRDHEKVLFEYTVSKLKDTFGNDCKIMGPVNPDHHAGIVSFSFGSYHAHDIAQILDEDHIAVRAGHHCAMPLHNHLNIPATTRASFYIYNDIHDIDKLIDGLKKVKGVLK